MSACSVGTRTDADDNVDEQEDEIESAINDADCDDVVDADTAASTVTRDPFWYEGEHTCLGVSIGAKSGVDGCGAV